MIKDILRNKQIVFGTIVILFMFCIAIFAPFIATNDPYETDLSPEARLQPPSRLHWFGTDDLGRDLFSRMVYGARISLSVGFVAVAIMILIGVTLGTLAGYYRGRVDNIIMRSVEIMMCFPSIYLILMIIAFLGQSILYIMIVIGVTSWMGLTRLVRAEFLSLRERDFVVAAKAVGLSDSRSFSAHIAERVSAGFCQRHAANRRCHINRERPELPRFRSSDTDTQLG
jgi:peptide/nickel transport system permease protein